jgi:hypothetical protein
MKKINNRLSKAEIDDLLGPDENNSILPNNEREEPTCKICKKKASELSYYIDQAKEEETTAAAIARSDGTYNWNTNKFYCMICYVGIGCPLGTA